MSDGGLLIVREKAEAGGQWKVSQCEGRSTVKLVDISGLCRLNADEFPSAIVPLVMHLLQQAVQACWVTAPGEQAVSP